MKASLAILAISTVSAWSFASYAFCQTTTCAQQNPPPECVPGVVVGSCQTSGLPLRWPNPCVSFSVQEDGSKKPGNPITAQQLQNLVRTSFDSWLGVDCPNGGKPNMVVDTYPKVECTEARYNRSGPNQNAWIFSDNAWPYQGDGERTIALTLVSFNPQTGEMYDVDVELNSFTQSFTLETVGNGFDLESVVQHESGHFLGLAHSDVLSATMWDVYTGITMRSLVLDDAAGICAVYPPVETSDPTCDAEPRHGFSLTCAADPGSGCSCALLSPNGTNRGFAVVLGAALGLLLLRLRCPG